MTTHAPGKASLEAVLLAALRERAPHYFPELGPVRTVQLINRRQRAYSCVLWASVNGRDGQSREVIIKAADDADRQFHAMMRVWPRFAAEQALRIPRPLDYLPQGPAILMESAPGTPLVAMLPRLIWSGAKLSAAEAHCAGAGRWLRLYHEITAEGRPASLNVDEKWGFLLEAFGQLLEAGLDPGLLQGLVERLRPIADDAVGHRRPLAHIHGDFTIDNVLVEGERTTGIDIWAPCVNTVDHDIASFLNSLLLLRLSRRVPDAALGRLRDAFFSGYDSREAGNEPATLLLQTIGLADVGLEILARRRSPLARAWVRQFLSHALSLLPRAAATRTQRAAAVERGQRG